MSVLESRSASISQLWTDVSSHTYLCERVNPLIGTGCEPTDLDVSPAMFDKMADHDLGRVTMTWAWLS